jgi:hypothetical protein
VARTKPATRDLDIDGGRMDGFARRARLATNICRTRDDPDVLPAQAGTSRRDGIPHRE